MRTRGARGRAYTLITPDNQYASRLPDLPGVQVIKLVTPRMAPARLGEYLLTLPDGPVACEIPLGLESFLFALDGEFELRSATGTRTLGGRGFAYLPADAAFALHGIGPARLLWLKRRYEPWPGGQAPAPLVGDAADVPATETGLEGLRRRELLDPTDPGFDFNMSLMAFDPGASLPFVEIHDEEHGLYMTAGGGSYVLDGDEHAVADGDFIYMAPYCPQWFAAGDAGAEYLLYKDVYRDGF